MKLIKILLLSMLFTTGIASAQTFVVNNLQINGTVTATNAIPVSALAQQAANTVLANGTGSTANVTAFSMPSCSTSASALNWTSGTGFTCNTTVNAATLGGATFASPGNIGTGTPGSGTFSSLFGTSYAGPAAGYSITTITGVSSGGALQIFDGTHGNQVLVLNGGATETTFGSAGMTMAPGYPIIPAQVAGIVGTTTNNNAQAGSIGECLPVGCGPTSTTGTSVSTNTATNCTSVSLTAGQWMVWGTVTFQPSAVLAQIVAGINTTSATLPATGLFQALSVSFTSANNQTLTAPPQILKLASTTTVYMIGQANITSGTLTCGGYLWATRVR